MPQYTSSGTTPVYNGTGGNGNAFNDVLQGGGYPPLNQDQVNALVSGNTATTTTTANNDTVNSNNKTIVFDNGKTLNSWMILLILLAAVGLIWIIAKIF